MSYFKCLVLLLTFVVVVAGQAVYAAAPTTGLALFLPFTGQAIDSSSANRMINTSNVTFGLGPTSMFNRAAYFNGQSSKIDFSPNLASTNEMTISMWIRNTRQGLDREGFF